MISGCRSDYQDDMQGINHRDQLYSEVAGASSSGGARGSESQLRSFLSSLSILKEKVNQVQSYANILAPQPNFHVNQQLITSDDESTSSIALATMGTIIQEIIFTSSSMMFNCQQMSLYYPNERNHHHHHIDHMASFSHLDGVENNVKNTSQAYVDEEGSFEWYTNNYTSTTTTATATTTTALAAERKPISKNISKQVVKSLSQEIYDIVELNVTDLLAKYTHYCQVCGKGFKRDANLRMHMRAHGDEYKSSAALSNPMKKINGETSSSSSINVPRKFSCPHEGCRWNKKHAKFQPLKSIICVKNHYKRSHCPKMYVCKRCNRKQFSVLSDLRTHEKHCGNVKWQCSCGTTFSRKDKLMGHVTLFVGHNPLVNHHLGSMDNKLDTQRATQIQF